MRLLVCRRVVFALLVSAFYIIADIHTTIIAPVFLEINRRCMLCVVSLSTLFEDFFFRL